MLASFLLYNLTLPPKIKLANVSTSPEAVPDDGPWRELVLPSFKLCFDEAEEAAVTQEEVSFSPLLSLGTLPHDCSHAEA